MTEQENERYEPSEPIVADDFVVPLELTTDHTVLRPLGPQHNESDHAAWTSSIDHIRATPGYGPDEYWPTTELTLARNLEDLEMHARHFVERVGFTYTVLDRGDQDEVVGCVYIYGDRSGEHEVEVRSWVSAARAELDREVWQAVTDWLAAAWPFETVRYAPRS